MDLQKNPVTKILIIDENILFREGLTAMLNGQSDFSVVGQADQIHRAIDYAIELKPDMILMDVFTWTGRDTEAIRQVLAIHPRTKIIVLTLHESDDLLFTAIQTGVKGFLQKNIPFSVLLISIRAAVRGEAAISRSYMTRVLDEFSRIRTAGYSGEPAPMGLTKRELEVIHELERGASNLDISHNLSITENTVKRHIHSILKKLGLRNRREAALYARHQGTGTRANLLVACSPAKTR